MIWSGVVPERDVFLSCFCIVAIFAIFSAATICW